MVSTGLKEKFFVFVQFHFQIQTIQHATMNSNVTLKVTFDGDLRRISVPTSISLADLKKRLANMFANFEELKLQYSDDEGDRITITSHDELEEAMRVAASTNNILRLFVSENKKKEEVKAVPVNNVVHAAYCDNCNVTIRGIRYKCGNCEDFDLCEACEKLPNVHNEEHLFVKIVKPLPHFAHQRRALLPPLYQPRWQRPHWGHWGHHGQQQGQQQGEEVKAPEQSRCPYVRRRWCRDVVPVQVNVANPEKAEVKPEEPVVAEPKQEEVKVEDVKPEQVAVEVKVEDVKEDVKPVVEEPKRELTRFEQMLVALEDMGFTDRRQNIELLVRSGGNLDSVVQQLLGVSLNN